MSQDDRIEERLREEATNDPRYRPGRFAEWAAKELTRQPTGRSRHVRARLRAASRVALVVAAAVGFGIGVGVIRDRVAVSQVGDASDLLSSVHNAGALRVAVRPDFPQATTGSLGGFDVDVATELAERLNVDLHLVTIAPDQMRSSAARWDIAMPSSAVVAADPAFAATDPYYGYPISLLVETSSPATAVEELANTRICVIAGSAGEAWLLGRYTAGSVTGVVDPPGRPSPQVEHTDEACLDALAAGTVDAFVTQRLGPADIAVLRSARALGGPVLTEPRTIVATRDGTNPTALLTEIDRVLAEMRADGTLADISRNRFGGRDLTTTEPAG
ncbi:MAG: transporter substrate-binding domain-containing protein [Chloroflexota bacterium]|nr:transporter substrate-binding domain-containing protein [Chloroflexota bacterium]